MGRKHIQKDSTRYFRQTDTLRLLGGGMAIVGLIWFYFGITYASYIIPTIITPIGVIMFMIGSSKHISDSDMEDEIKSLLHDYDMVVKNRPDYGRVVLKHPADVETMAYRFNLPAMYFKRGKNSVLMSDICVKSHFFFTANALLICVRELCLSKQADEDGRIGDREVILCFEDMTRAFIRETEQELMLTNTKKKARVKQVELVIMGQEDELLSLPIHNDMDTYTLCEAINQCISETK